MLLSISARRCKLHLKSQCSWIKIILLFFNSSQIARLLVRIFLQLYDIILRLVFVADASLIGEAPCLCLKNDRYSVMVVDAQLVCVRGFAASCAVVDLESMVV